MKQIDQRRLVGDQQQNLLTVQSFLVKAREALTEKDVQRALTLADKAYLLAEELVKVRALRRDPRAARVSLTSFGKSYRRRASSSGSRALGGEL